MNKIIAIGSIIGHFTKTNYTTYTYEDGLIEVCIDWPELDWNDKPILIGDALSTDEAIALVNRRENLISTGNSVL